MCGIAGYIKKKSSKNNIKKILDQMNSSQIHRGPNSTNFYICPEEQAGLVMCRLSILDLELGVQPMTSKDGRYTIIFNGTILNSPDLREELEKRQVSRQTLPIRNLVCNIPETEMDRTILVGLTFQRLHVACGPFRSQHFKKLKL